MSRKLTKEEFTERAKAIHGDKYDYSLVKIEGNNKTNVKIKCKTCSTIFEQRVNNHLNGSGCPECAKRKRGNILIKIHTAMTAEEFIAKARAVHGNKYGYDRVEYKGALNEKVIITCPIHGDFPMLPHNHTSRKEGCPKCKQSHLENETMLLLEQSSIAFETQQTFSWLKNKREMSLDFYLPEYNVAIECQGIQHYKPNNLFTEDIVVGIKERDKLKLQLCKEHNIPIYYINYNDNVEEKLNSIIKILKNKG